jgi:WD40 repeat protein
VKFKLLALILLFLLSPHIVIRAQSDAIIKRFEVTAPYGYEPGYQLSWSPDGTLIALLFTFQEVRADRRAYGRWQVYDVQTGELVNEFADLIAWSADSRRLVARRAFNAPPQILDAHRGTLLGTLKEAGDSFAYDLVYVPRPFVITEDVLPNLDRSTNTLRFHDAQTGELLQTLDSVFELPVYTHDQSHFAVNTETGVQIYDAESYDLLHTLDGFIVLLAYQSPWSPDDQHLLVKPQDAYRKLGPLHIWTPDDNLSAPIYNITGMMAWSPDSSTLAAPTDYSKIRLYDSESGELAETIHGFSEGGTSIIEWQGNYLISFSGNDQFTGFVLNVWDTETHAFLFQGGVDRGFQYHFQDNLLEIYEPLVGLSQIDLTTGATIQETVFDRFLPYRSPDWRWLIGRDDPASPAPIYVYQIEPFALVATLQGHSDADTVQYAEWSPDSRHFASVGLTKVIVWEVVED